MHLKFPLINPCRKKKRKKEGFVKLDLADEKTPPRVRPATTIERAASTFSFGTIAPTPDSFILLLLLLLLRRPEARLVRLAWRPRQPSARLRKLDGGSIVRRSCCCCCCCYPFSSPSSIYVLPRYHHHHHHRHCARPGQKTSAARATATPPPLFIFPYPFLWSLQPLLQASLGFLFSFYLVSRIWFSSFFFFSVFSFSTRRERGYLWGYYARWSCWSSNEIGLFYMRFVFRSYGKKGAFTRYRLLCKWVFCIWLSTICLHDLE